MQRATKHVVALQHGSHGHRKDLRYLRHLLVGRSDVVVVETSTNEGMKTDDGVRSCGLRLAEAINNVVSQLAHEDVAVELSAVGHSFGGLIIREALFDLSQSGLLSGVRCRTMCTVAAPHLGVREMPSKFLQRAGRAIGKVYSLTYRELFLDDDTLASYLVSPEHLAALGLFERRVCYAAEHDRLVPPASAALCNCQVHREGGGALWMDRSGLEIRTVTLNSGSDTKLRDATKRSIAEKLLSCGSWESSVVDMTHTPQMALAQGGTAWLRHRHIVTGSNRGSHRAIVCKDPFYVPAAFGGCTDHLLTRVL